MSKSLEEQIAAQLMAMNVIEVPKTEEVIQPQVQVVALEPVRVEEPIIKTSEPVVVPTNLSKSEQENQPKLFNWFKTRLNLVLVQGTEYNKENEFLKTNEKTLWLNKPLSTYVLEGTDEKYIGYLASRFIPFVTALRQVTKPDSVNQLGTERDVEQLYKAIAVNILENASKFLPSSGSDRINLICHVSTEKNSFVNDVILEFYLVYKTDYEPNEILEKFSKIEKAVAKHNLTSNNFELHTTLVFSLNDFPNNLEPMLASGFTKENYLNTKALPLNKEDRNSILGVIPTTKQPLPNIVLSKKM